MGYGTVADILLKERQETENAIRWYFRSQEKRERAGGEREAAW